MLSSEIVEKARLFRGVSVKDLQRALGITNYYSKLRNTGNLNTKSFYEMLDALDFYVLIIPKEDIQPSKLKNCMKMNLFGTTLEFNVCPKCGHKLSPKEASYVGCPYCFSRYRDIVVEEDEVVNTPFFVHPPRTPEGVENVSAGLEDERASREEVLREDSRKQEFDLDELLDTGEEDV